jgi:hypothetical protein
MFLLRAIYAYRRSERDSFARIGEAFGFGTAEDWPKASHRVRFTNRHSGKLWKWAYKRWGQRWVDLHYKIKNEELDKIINNRK